MKNKTSSRGMFVRVNALAGLYAATALFAAGSVAAEEKTREPGSVQAQAQERAREERTAASEKYTESAEWKAINRNLQRVESRLRVKDR